MHLINQSKDDKEGCCVDFRKLIMFRQTSCRCSPSRMETPFGPMTAKTAPSCDHTRLLTGNLHMPEKRLTHVKLKHKE